MRRAPQQLARNLHSLRRALHAEQLSWSQSNESRETWKTSLHPGHPPRAVRRRARSTVQSERRARWILVASVLGALGFFWAGATLSRREETVGIRSLPAAERQSLYARTLEELSTICRDTAATGGELHDHCVAQARFMLELPECDDACQSAAAAVLPHARR